MGGVNKMKLQEEKKKRREFTYVPASLKEYQKQFLINKMVRLDEDTLAEKLNNDADMVENWHCQIVKNLMLVTYFVKVDYQRNSAINL